MKPRVFLLSPAYSGGERGRLLLNQRSQFELALRLQTSGAPLGEVFQFISSLYFRGKMAYCQAFGSPPPGAPCAVVITAGVGLIPPETMVTMDELREIAGVPIDAGDERYRTPLERDARELARIAGEDCDFVLLGSVASEKYVEPLIKVFGTRLLFPAEFVGRGDMSRGGLMLRSARDGTELQYVQVAGATLRGKRPPKLPKLPRP